MKPSIESLSADLAALRARVDVLEAKGKPAVVPPVIEEGAIVFYPVPVAKLPSDAELRRACDAALAAHPSLGIPAVGMSANQFTDNFFADFRVAYEFVSTLYRTEKINETRSAISWCAMLFNWLLDTRRSPCEVWPNALLAAAIAQGVKVRLGETPRKTYLAMDTTGPAAAHLAA